MYPLGVDLIGFADRAAVSLGTWWPQNSCRLIRHSLSPLLREIGYLIDIIILYIFSRKYYFIEPLLRLIVSSSKQRLDQQPFRINESLNNKISFQFSLIALHIMCQYFRKDEIKDKYKVKTTTDYVYDNATSTVCNSLFQMFDSNPLLKIFWKFYKHLIL